MAFEPGHEKVGGRKPGSKNVKRAVREIVEAALGQSIPERILSIVQAQSDPKWEAEILMDLLPYSYPKLSSIEAKIEDHGDELRARVDRLIDFLETD